MVVFRQKVNKQGKIYLAKPLRQAGLVNTLEILPNSKAAVIYQVNTPIEDILASLKIIIADLKHQARTLQGASNN